jgi:hypothetical protein
MNEGKSEEKAELFELTLTFTPDESKKIRFALEEWKKQEMTQDEIVSMLKLWAYKSIDSNVRSMSLPIGYNS